MKLKNLLQEISTASKVNSETANLIIRGIADSSADVLHGYMFVAINGFNQDGHQFILEAIEKGACLIVGESEISDLTVPYIQVENSRKALGIIANKFYGNPSNQKLMIGITGTNGKTTTSYILKHILESNGKSCSLIGTIQNVINGRVKKSANTTPSSLDLHKLIAESKDEVVIVEVSSHGLSQHRVQGITFDFCLFTNLEHEHLDYHLSMEDYFQTKMLLFDHLKEAGQAIVNTDNHWGKRLAKVLQGKGINVNSIGQSTNNKVRILYFNVKNSTIFLEDGDELNLIFSPMHGIHNMYNTLMAYVSARLVGLSEDSIIESVSNFQGVEGRFEKTKLSNGATIVVDYAHTAEAILNCLTTAKRYGAERVIHIFGFRGDRDQSKRQEMLTVTSGTSDQYILTLDDLNSVPQSEMIEMLDSLNNLYGNERGLIIPDRTLAIKWAIEHSNPDDWIIVTGKGQEIYQQNYRLQTNSDKDTVLYITNKKKHSWSS
ncbi:UDP-N-acetylmuramoyl-L-alanyl-D-glutamate--2,6-diaminopimelate ligase [Oceanobacillus massiliensis]|uniref:UDP-N-acetylmuramoyl-L-alanyl-D-glutamate--2, 6-diaminopimelate ligase n=1 Tax=Oceanobacillus massiliensis TaxID=1465765 RepID=UPI000289578D|nr:UDP-N-acetylmuramoyl-L-alanyl-D-glutamate--2,6-diaminopimelate ligase [Oceanobacillus massiliensis]